jgi:hypothetical protein
MGGSECGLAYRLHFSNCSLGISLHRGRIDRNLPANGIPLAIGTSLILIACPTADMAAAGGNMGGLMSAHLAITPFEFLYLSKLFLGKLLLAGLSPSPPRTVCREV